MFPDCDGSGGPSFFDGHDELAVTDPPDCSLDGFLDCSQLNQYNDYNHDGRYDNCVPCQPIADWDGNGLTQPADVSAFVAAWSADLANNTLIADFDHNGMIQPADISLFVGTWFAQLSAGCS